MGERAYAGHLIYTAYETQYLTQIPLDPDPRVPDNRFLLIRVNVVNSGGEEAVAPAMTIEDEMGKTYEELSDGRGVPQWITYIRTIKPGSSVQGWAVFDAPPKHYKLRAHDEVSDRYVLIDVPLTYGSENPDIALPAPKQ